MHTLTLAVDESDTAGAAHSHGHQQDGSQRSHAQMVGGKLVHLTARINNTRIRAARSFVVLVCVRVSMSFSIPHTARRRIK